MVNQLAPAAADHVHPGATSTDTTSVAPPAGYDPPFAETAYVQPDGWLTLKDLPAMVSVAERAAAVFRPALNCTVPGPLPLAPLVIVNQFAPDAADHEHDPAVVTLTVPVPPAPGIDAFDGEMSYVQPDGWFTVNDLPAMLSVVVRAAPVFKPALNCTVPGPMPLAPLAIDTQSAPAAADHGQAAVVVTFTEPVPPAPGIDAFEGEMSYAHPSDCVTLTGCPATIRRPTRGGPVVGSASNVTRPEPRPLEPALIAIHSASARAVHSHSALLAVTSTSRAAPDGGMLVSVAESWKRQDAGLCVICNWRSPTRTEPDRGTGSSVLPTEKSNVALPCPSAGERSTIHDTSAEAAH
jgi:hypothetical protein